MRLYRLILGAVVFYTTMVFGNVNAGICQLETGNLPGFPQAVCQLPNCPGGGDCLPPTLDKSTSRVEYAEPLMQWKEHCPNTAYLNCWEVFLDFKALVSTSDPSGVGFVGVTVVSEIGNSRNFKKYWAKAESKDVIGRYELNGGMVVYVPASQKFRMSVQELCARDLLNNEVCIPL